MTDSTDGRLPAPAGWVVVAGSAAGLIATYWDDSWHTVLGRDSAFIPPHLLLYASILAVGMVLASWVVVTFMRTRSVRATVTAPGLSLAVAAGAATALAAPADAAWHAAFGRDSVLWSPPHLLSVIGTAALLVAALIGVGERPRALRIGLAAGLLGAAQVLVLEYDTNVPQFAEWLYVPLLVLTGLGAAWVARSLVGGPRAVTWILGAYVTFRVVVFLALAVPGWLAPDFPLALLGLAVLDVPERVGRLRWPLAGVAIAILQIVASAADLSSVQFGSSVIGALATVSVLVVVVLVLVVPRKVLSASALVLVVLGTPFWTAEQARAHDPGQGPQIGTAELAATGDGAGNLRVSVTNARVSDDSLAPVRLLVRRAGRTVNGALESGPVSGAGSYAGSITLPDAGLWFVYAELRSGGRNVETWLPVSQDLRGQVVRERAIYEPAGAGARPVGEFVAGGMLLVAGALLIGWAAISVRRTRLRP